MAHRLISKLPSLSFALLVPLVGLGALGVWSYAPTLAMLARCWAHDPQYSHGYLVPLFAAVMLAMRPQQRAAVVWQFSWLGVPVLAAACVLRLLGDYFFIARDWLDAFSLVVSVAGLFALFGGWPALRWAWTGVAFLLFMIPLPFTVERALAYPLRTVATQASNYVLQTIGLPSLAQGHTILFYDVRLGVAEACSGLSMLVIFVALSTAVAVTIRRPLLDRVVILLSAVPVAVLANVARITVTALMHLWAGREWADLVFHDLAGWLMMPFALALLGAELWFLRRLLVEPPARRPVPLTLD
jgi:exosortase